MAKRFFRSRLAVVGLVILAVMFVFSFMGGVVSPYSQDQVFYRREFQSKEYAGVTENSSFRYSTAEGQSFTGMVQAQFMLAASKGQTSFTYDGVTCSLAEEGEDCYVISQGTTPVALAYKAIVNAEDPSLTVGFDFQLAALKSYTNGAQRSTVDGTE